MTIQITTELIKQLRDATGVSVMQCKKALEEAEGNMDKAILILKKKSSDIALKKADRETTAGLVVIKNAPGKSIALVLACETDFVAKNSDFVDLSNKLADMVLASGKDATMKEAESIISPVIQKVGENIKIDTIEVVEGPVIGSYVHNGKAGVIVSLEGGDADLARDVAMHIAALKPEYKTLEDVTDETKAALKDMFQKEVSESDKPEEIKTKMLEGKIQGFLKERVLVEQPFIKDGDMTIGALLKKNNATVKQFMSFTI